MFILEEPYISELLISTLEKNNFPVLKNELSEKIAQKGRKLNLIDGKVISKTDNEKIYANSENAIDFILKTCQNSQTARLIKICKDKYEFRTQLKPVYPDFHFDKISIEDIDKISVKKLPQSFIIKPSVGFLSMGVHKVSSHKNWEETKNKIKNEVNDFKKNFPLSVLSPSEFIIEEIIEGEEFAVDAYFNNNGETVILNIFKHPFVSEDDVSDRAYITGEKIISDNLKTFEAVLKKIGIALNMKNFPVHIELISKMGGDVIPVEINPMRFAGWCTTDLAFFAYGINIYEYFYFDKKPNWETILKDKKDKIYYFAMAETPPMTDKSKIDFDYEKLKSEFSKILDFRKIDFINKPMFAVIFGEAKDEKEIDKILELKMCDFIKDKIAQ